MSELINNTAALIEEFVMNPIKDDLNSKGIDNTGRAAESLRVEAREDQDRVILWGIDYIEFLNKGRGPGKFPPEQAIRDWVVVKLGLEGDELERVIGLIRVKIADEGTTIFKDNSRGIQLENKVINLRAEIKKQAPGWAKATVLNKLRKFQKARLKNQ